MDGAARVERALAQHLPQTGRLAEAMRYAVLNGGKRLRAALIYATAADFSLPLQEVDEAAMAMEALHAYSLVHDDLPAMDDDDWRRGRPSCHRQFDEATAILAGDALQAWAWQRIQLAAAGSASILARAAFNMVEGQVLDMAATGQILDLSALQNMHRLKTGALLEACLHLGALASPQYASHEAQLQQLGQHWGLAYQILDDVLDAQESSATLGKSAGKDAAAGKASYVQILGMERSQSLLQKEIAAGEALLAALPQSGQHLRALLLPLFQRRY